MHFGCFVQDFGRLTHWLGDLVVHFGKLAVDFCRYVVVLGSFVVRSSLGLELAEVVGYCL